MAPPERSAAVHPPTPMRQRVGLPSPEQLPEGAVLVVGSAQSGCQITEDLLAACRSGTGAPSRRLVVQAGFMDQRPRDLPDPSMMFAAMAIVAPGRGLRRPALARAGARLVGRPVAVAGERVAFDPRSRPTWPRGRHGPQGPGQGRPAHRPPRPARATRPTRPP
jgi:hypothetical protein